MSRREMDRPTPALWWSRKLDAFVGEHRSESGNYEVIGYDRDGWYVAEEQEIELPDDAVIVRSAAGAPTEQPGDGIDPTIASGYRLEDVRDLSPRDLGFGADGHSDEQTGGER